MRLTRLILICLMAFAMNVYGQNEKETKWRPFSFAVSVGLNNYDAWELHGALSYRPIRYVAVSAGLMYCDIYNDHVKTNGNLSGSDTHQYWELSDKHDLNYRLAFQPEIQLYSPAVNINKDKDKLSLMVACGMTMPIPTNVKVRVDYITSNPARKSTEIGNKGAKSSPYYHYKLAAVYETGRVSVSLGDCISNFDMYGGARNIVVEGQKFHLIKRRINNSVYAEIKYSF